MSFPLSSVGVPALGTFGSMCSSGSQDETQRFALALSLEAPAEESLAAEKEGRRSPLARFALLAALLGR